MSEHGHTVIVVVDARGRPQAYLALETARSKSGAVGEHLTPLPAVIRPEDDLRTAVSLMFMHDLRWLAVRRRRGCLHRFRHAEGHHPALGRDLPPRVETELKPIGDLSHDAFRSLRPGLADRRLDRHVRARHRDAAQRDRRPNLQVPVGHHLPFAAAHEAGRDLRRARDPGRRSAGAVAQPSAHAPRRRVDDAGPEHRQHDSDTRGDRARDEPARHRRGAGDLRPVGRLAAADRPQYLRRAARRAGVLRRGRDRHGHAAARRSCRASRCRTHCS